MTDQTEYVLVSDHTENLSGGALLAPGERVKARDLSLSSGEGDKAVVGGDQYLVDDGKLVDVNDFDVSPEPTKADLLERAKDLDVKGRSSMNADELAEAIFAREQELAAESGSTGPAPDGEVA